MRSASFLQFIKFLHMPCALWQRHISICFLVFINISWSLDIVSWHLIWRSGHFLCIIYSRECWGSVLVLMSGWIHWFARSLDAEAETPILWPPDSKNQLIGKDPDAGKDWRLEVKETTENEMVGWHHSRDGHEFVQASEVGNAQGSLVCCSPQGRKESDATERLNWAELRLCQRGQSESLTGSWSRGFKVLGCGGGAGGRSDHHLLFLWGTGSWDTYLGPQLSCLHHGKLRTQQLTEKKHHFWDWEVRVYLTLNVSKHSPRSTGWDLV